MHTIKRIGILLGSLTIAGFSYFIYLKNCYRYLKSLGYDHPPPKFFVGNLLEFKSQQNSVKKGLIKPAISHYSKTLRRFTSKYGKIYGFYEGHSPVIVLADADLVTEFFVNQNKLTSFRRSFPMSKKSDDPTADVFISNGIRWLRLRYGLEKIMLNLKNLARCLEYTDESFLSAFIKQPDLNKPQKEFKINERARLFIVFAMFNIIFGTDLQTFIREKPDENQVNKLFRLNTNEVPNLKHAEIVANRFNDAFEDYESFSFLKFFAMTMPELAGFWRSIENFKKYFNANICATNVFADPMDWFHAKFINKHLLLYSADSSKSSETTEQTDLFSTASSNSNKEPEPEKSSNLFTARKFGYLNSFLLLTTNSIFKYPKNNLNNRLKIYNPIIDNMRNRALTSAGSIDSPKIRSFSDRHNSNSENSNNSKKTRTFSNDFHNLDKINKKHRMSYLSTSILTKETESNEFENWKLSIDEAISNSLLMLFAGYETTSSAIGFCCHVLRMLPEEKYKLIEEIKAHWKDLSFNMDKYQDLGKESFERNDNFLISDSESSLNDDVFEEDNKKPKNSLDEWTSLYDSLEKLKYLDMFIKEVLRMFPIANSMVSRKCVLDDFYLDGGKYFIPKNMNVVVDVLSIHYDNVLWGPVDTEIFYPLRFAQERNPASWLAFGIGARKCLGMKLAIMQIKLFIVRLLQNFQLEDEKKISENGNLADSIETKDLLFNGPIQNVQISIERKKI